MSKPDALQYKANPRVPEDSQKSCWGFIVVAARGAEKSEVTFAKEVPLVDQSKLSGGFGLFLRRTISNLGEPRNGNLRNQTIAHYEYRTKLPKGEGGGASLWCRHTRAGQFAAGKSKPPWHTMRNMVS